jgi:uncharacterized membrane protein YgcG
MAVVLVNYLPPGYTIEDYATLIGRKWHVGRANDGLVYVAAIKQHKQRLEVAQNLQKYITDERAANVLDLLKIDLKENLYYDAMKTLVDRSAVELADGKMEWTSAEKIRIAEKHSADSLARAETLTGGKAGSSSYHVWYYIVGAIALYIFWKPVSSLFMLILVIIFPSLRKKEPIIEDEEYENEMRSATRSYRNIRRSRSTSYRSSEVATGLRTFLISTLILWPMNAAETKSAAERKKENKSVVWKKSAGKMKSAGRKRKKSAARKKKTAAAKKMSAAMATGVKITMAAAATRRLPAALTGAGHRQTGNCARQQCLVIRNHQAFFVSGSEQSAIFYLKIEL